MKYILSLVLGLFVCSVSAQSSYFTAEGTVYPDAHSSAVVPVAFLTVNAYQVSFAVEAQITACESTATTATALKTCTRFLPQIPFRSTQTDMQGNFAFNGVNGLSIVSPGTTYVFVVNTPTGIGIETSPSDYSKIQITLYTANL